MAYWNQHITSFNRGAHPYNTHTNPISSTTYRDWTAYYWAYSKGTLGGFSNFWFPARQTHCFWSFSEHMSVFFFFLAILLSFSLVLQNTRTILIIFIGVKGASKAFASSLFIRRDISSSITVFSLDVYLRSKLLTVVFCFAGLDRIVDRQRLHAYKGLENTRTEQNI